MFGLGAGEIAVIVVLALLVLGPDKLPELARTIGKAMRELRKASNDLRANLELDDEPLHRSYPPPTPGYPPLRSPNLEVNRPTPLPAVPPAPAAPAPTPEASVDATPPAGSGEGTKGTG